MPSVFGMTCGCGRSISVPCDSVGEIPVAAQRLDDHGWGYDERGRVRCPQCGRPPLEEAATAVPASTSAQLSLFSEDRR